MDRRKRLWTWLSGYRRAVHLETCTHGSEGGGGDGAAKQPRRPPTLLAAVARNEGLGLFEPRETRTCFGVVGPKRCAVAKVCLVLSGESRPRWKKAGQTIR